MGVQELFDRVACAKAVFAHLDRQSQGRKAEWLRTQGHTMKDTWGPGKLNAEIRTALGGLGDDALLALALELGVNIEGFAETAPTEEPFVMPGKGAGSGELQQLGPGEIAVGQNPRKDFDLERLQELAASVAAYGVLQPLVVNQVDGQHELIAGERRLRAARMAGLPFVPCVVLRVSRREAAELRLLENLQRQDLSAVEEAGAFAELVREHGYTQEQLATKLGKSQGWVSERLGLLDLPEVVQEAVARRGLSTRAALALRPYILRSGEIPQAVQAVGKRMAEELPRAAEAVAWVVSCLWPATHRLQEADAGDIRYHLGQGASPPQGRLFPWDQEVEGVKAPACSECPRRCVLGYSEEARCLQPSCWERKQAAAWEPRLKAHQEAAATRESAKEERLHQQAQRGVERGLEGAAEAPVPVDELAVAAIRLRELGQEYAQTYQHEKKAALQSKMGQAAETLGFASLEEMETGLAGGTGRMHAGMFQPPELAKRLAGLLVRKAAGEDIARPAPAPAGAAQKHPGAAAPLPGADAAAAQGLCDLGRRSWGLGDGAGKGDILYEREMYLPLADLLTHWEERDKLGASQMPPQLGGAEIHIPEQGVWIEGHQSSVWETSLALLDGRVSVGCSGGRVEEPLPEAPIYWRVRLYGGAGGKSLHQQLVIPGVGRHIVISGDSFVMMRKELVPKWQRLMNALPGMPERPA